MTYILDPSDDITTTRTFDADSIDEKLRLCINRLDALFDIFDKTKPTFGGVMGELFQTFVRTHRSIRLLLKEAKTDSSFISDAMSLVREQVEKIFVVALLMEDPSKWIKVYYKDDWRKLYKHEELLVFVERSRIERFREADREAIETSEVWRKRIGLSDKEKEFIKFKHDNPRVSKPAHLTGVEIPIFPTPGGVIDAVTDAATKEFLTRWHKEYEYVCGFSHIGLEKMFQSVVSRSGAFSTGEKEIMMDKSLAETAMLSYLTAGSAMIVAWKYIIGRDPALTHSVAFLNALTAFWDELQEVSLLAKVLWKMYVKDALPPGL